MYVSAVDWSATCLRAARVWCLFQPLTGLWQVSELPAHDVCFSCWLAYGRFQSCNGMMSVSAVDWLTAGFRAASLWCLFQVFDWFAACLRAARVWCMFQLLTDLQHVSELQGYDVCFSCWLAYGRFQSCKGMMSVSAVDWLTAWFRAASLWCLFQLKGVFRQSFQGCIHSVKVLKQVHPFEVWQELDWASAVSYELAFLNWQGCPINLDSGMHFMGKGQWSWVCFVFLFGQRASAVSYELAFFNWQGCPINLDSGMHFMGKGRWPLLCLVFLCSEELALYAWAGLPQLARLSH